jgi:hypothetical protein
MSAARTWAVALPLAVGLGACGGGDTPAPISACGFPDGEPNDDAVRATGQDLGTMFQGCLAAGDADHFALRAPADRAGGYVQGSITGAAGIVRVTVYDPAGGAELASFVAAGPEMPVTFFFAVSPSADARIAVSDAGGAASPYPYQLATVYTALADPYEPNESQDTAAEIGPGTSTAYLFAAQRDAGDDPIAYDDWYYFEATADTATIRMEDVPTDVAARLFLFRADGSEVARVASGILGGALTMRPPMPLGAGQHFVRVATWADAPAAMGEGAAMPDHFTRPYRLTLEQP